MNSAIARLVALTGSLALGACATVNSNPIPLATATATPEHARNGSQFDGAVAPGSQAGIAYFLPRQLVKITVSRKSVALTQAIDAFAAARLAVATAEAKVEDTKAAINSTENAIVDVNDSPEALVILQKRLTQFLAAKADAETKVAEAKAKLDTARLALEAARQGQARSINLSNLAVAVETAHERTVWTASREKKAQDDKLAAKVKFDKADTDLKADPTNDSLRVAKNAAERDLANKTKALADLAVLHSLAASDEKILSAELQNRQGSGIDVGGLDGRVDPNFTVNVEFALQAPTADPAAGYRLDPRHSILRDDEHKLTLTSEGLITSTDTLAIDRTGEVIVQLASFGGALAGLGMPGAGIGLLAESAPKTRDPMPDVCRYAPQAVTALVDLTSTDQVNKVNERIACLGAFVDIDAGSPLTGTQPGGSVKVSVDGIAYRTPTGVLVHVRKCEQEITECVDEDGRARTARGGPWTVAQTISFSLPQAGPVSFIRQNAGFMTRSSYKLAFKDGILTGYDSSRPSEASAAAGLPMRVVNGVFDGVSKVLTLRIGANKQVAELTDSQRLIADAKTNLAASALTGDKKLFDEQLNLLKSKLLLQQGGIDGDKNLLDAELKLLQSLSTLETARVQAPGNASTVQLNALIVQLRNQARLEAINKCVSEKIAAGAAYDSCLVSP